MPALLFDAVTVAVIPIYGAMAFAPRSKVTKAITHDRVFLLGSLLYVFLLARYGGGWTMDGMSLPRVDHLAELMKDGRACSMAWLHLLLMDLFQARHVYLDSVSRNLPAALRVASLSLSFMVAPIGLLLHLIVSNLYRRFQIPLGS